MELYFLYGILTGLIPSLHPNNLVNLIPKENLLEIAIIHSFISIIPNIYFLVPDVYTISSLNASHKLFKKGKAFYAVFLSGLGSLLGGLFSLIFYKIPEIFYFIGKLKSITVFLFLFLILLSPLRQKTIKKKIIALILLLDASLLIYLNYFVGDDYFLPLLGFFGLSSLLTFSTKKIEQNLNPFGKIYLKELLYYSFLGSILSIPANVFPLTTPTHFLLILLTFNKIKLESSIILVSSMSTSDFILSLITKEYYGYSRNYVIQNCIGDLDISLLFIGFFLLILIGFFVTLINNLINRKLLVTIVLLSIFWPFLLNINLLSVIVIFTSAFLGFLSLKFEIERINLFNGYLINYILKGTSFIS